MSYVVLPGALVKVLKNDIVLAQLVTDINGIAELYLPKDGYMVCASKTGYSEACTHVYLNKDTDIELILRRIVELLVSQSGTFSVKTEVVDEGSIYCIVTKFDPGYPKWFPSNGYSELFSWCSSDELNDTWSITETYYAEPEVYNSALRPRATDYRTEFACGVERSLPMYLIKLYLTFKITNDEPERITLTLYDSNVEEYPKTEVIIESVVNEARLYVTIRRWTSASFYKYKKWDIAPLVEWDGETLIIYNHNSKNLYLYKDMINYYVLDFPSGVDYDYPWRVRVKLESYNRSQSTSPGEYYLPWIDWIGFIFGE